MNALLATTLVAFTMLVAAIFVVVNFRGEFQIVGSIATFMLLTVVAWGVFQLVND